MGFDLIIFDCDRWTYQQGPLRQKSPMPRLRIETGPRATNGYQPKSSSAVSCRSRWSSLIGRGSLADVVYQDRWGQPYTALD